jgi:hypothetical protein
MRGRSFIQVRQSVTQIGSQLELLALHCALQPVTQLVHSAGIGMSTLEGGS